MVLIPKLEPKQCGYLFPQAGPAQGIFKLLLCDKKEYEREQRKRENAKTSQTVS